MRLTRAAEPEKQYALVDKHVRRLREVDMLKESPVVIMVERNLGFEVRARLRAAFSRHVPTRTSSCET